MRLLDQSDRFDHDLVKTFSMRFENFLLVKPASEHEFGALALVGDGIAKDSGHF
jgi:hypothetical protein